MTLETQNVIYLQVYYIFQFKVEKQGKVINPISHNSRKHNFITTYFNTATSIQQSFNSEMKSLP